MKRTAGSVVLLLLGYAVVEGCAERTEVEECHRVCDNVARCDYLPSPLGTGSDAETNCRQRCELSSSPKANALRACDQHDCDELRSCLIQAAGLQVLGKRDVTITVQMKGDDSCTAGAGGAAAAPDTQGNGGQPSWCQASHVGLVVPFVRTLQQTIYGEASDCADDADGSYTVREVPIGSVERAGVELRGTDVASNAPFCWVLEASDIKTVATESSANSAKVSAPERLSCAEPLISCLPAPPP